MALPAFQKFDVFTDENSLGVRWDKYVTKFENLIIALNITANKRKKALLLHYAGDDVFDIYETLNLGGSDDNYDETKEALSAYFKPRKNTQFEIYEFRNMKQLSGETIDQYSTRLRQKATNCEFDNIDNEIKSQFIQGVRSQKLRMKCLQESEKSLQDLLTMARTSEIAQRQAQNMTSENNEQVVAVKNKTYKHVSRPSVNYRQNSQPQTFRRQPSRSQVQASPKKQDNKKCRNCGGKYPHQNRCPAIGKECNYCHVKNHFISVCRKRLGRIQGIEHRPEVNNEEYSENEEYGDFQNVSDEDSEEYEMSYGLSHGKNVPKTNIKLNGVNVNVLVDSGSSINVISEESINKMKNRPVIKKSKTKAFAFGQKSALPIKGQCSLLIETEDKFITRDFHIITGNTETLISYQLSVDLGIFPQINSVKHDKYQEMVQEYSSVFKGLGKLKDRKVKLHIDESVIPVAQPLRRVPFHVREKVEKELKHLEKMDIIEKVEHIPTTWLSNIVAAPKRNNPDEVRICVDMRKANTAIKTEKQVSPTIDDIILTLNGATVFSRLDLNKAFHQIELDESSRNVTTFQTHDSIWRYKRLNFGLKQSPVLFQNEIRRVLQGLPGIMNIADDLVCFGKTREEHDSNLRGLFERLKEHQITLNKNKCSFGQAKISFYGYIFSESGISPDPAKIEAVKNMDRPNSVSQVRSYLGLTNYLSKFVDQYSTITEPLRRLTHKDTKFEWTDEQETSFQKLKEVLVSDKVMTFFDPTKETELWTDGSPSGASGILIQNGKIVAYGSKAFNPVQQRFSQTEREFLSTLLMIEHFRLYLYGKQFTLITDHSALQSLFNNTKNIQNARLERWRLRLVTYEFNVIYRPGHLMISDYLSRHPVSPATRAADSISEQYIHFIAANAMPTAIKLSDVARATNSDCLLDCVKNAIRDNSWTSQKCQINEQFRLYENLNKNNELTIMDTEDGSVILRGTQICVPESLQRQLVVIAHEGHQGQSKCKGLLREYCWFPYMDRLVDDECKSCIPCQAATYTHQADPLKPLPLPQDIFSEVSVDFCGPFPDGSYVLVLIDDYSRYPIVEVISSLTAETVIPRLESIFAIFGYPDILKSDSGPPFQGRKFREYTENAGIKHKRVTPLHPQANGTVERFMAPLQKAIKTAIASGQNYRKALNSYLLNYRSSPHSSTGSPPATIMFNRTVKNRLPKLPNSLDDKLIRDKDNQSKIKNKLYADRSRHSKRRNLRVGNRVLIRNEKRNKFQTIYHPQPGIIVAKKGSMITISHNGKRVTRDISKFKRVQNKVPTGTRDNGIRDNEKADHIPNEQQINIRPRRQNINKPIRYRD